MYVCIYIQIFVLLHLLVAALLLRLGLGVPQRLRKNGGTSNDSLERHHFFLLHFCPTESPRRAAPHE